MGLRDGDGTSSSSQAGRPLRLADAREEVGPTQLSLSCNNSQTPWPKFSERARILDSEVRVVACTPTPPSRRFHVCGHLVFPESCHRPKRCDLGCLASLSPEGCSCLILPPKPRTTGTSAPWKRGNRSGAKMKVPLHPRPSASPVLLPASIPSHRLVQSCSSPARMGGSSVSLVCLPQPAVPPACRCSP